MLQFIFNGPQCLFAIDGCELTRAKCRETILRFDQPSPVNGILFNGVKAAPERVNNLRPLQWRELQSFVRQNRTIHAVNLNPRPRNASLLLELDLVFAFRTEAFPATTSRVSWLYSESEGSNRQQFHQTHFFHKTFCQRLIERCQTNGNIYGAVLGGMILGMLEVLASGYFPNGSDWRDVIAFTVLIVMLLFRPSGILGEKIVHRI